MVVKQGSEFPTERYLCYPKVCMSVSQAHGCGLSMSLTDLLPTCFKESKLRLGLGPDRTQIGEGVVDVDLLYPTLPFMPVRSFVTLPDKAWACIDRSRFFE